MPEKENSLSDDLKELKEKFAYDSPKANVDADHQGLVIHHTTVPGSYYYLLGFLRGMYLGILCMCLGVSVVVWAQIMMKED